MKFIRQPDPAKVLESELADARADAAYWKNKARQAEASELKAKAAMEEMQEECPECEDMCALVTAVNNADHDLSICSHELKTEWAECSYWANQLRCKGLNKELALIQQLFGALLCEKELNLAVAHFNKAFCNAQNVGPYIDCKKSELLELLECKDDIDPRCLTQIEKALCAICA